MQPFETILHPTDFSGQSAEALKLACALAHVPGARLVLLHVIAADRNEFDLESYPGEMKEMLQLLPMPALPAPVERVVQVGDPAEAILDVAREWECGLIVMGTRGRPEDGSVAAEVIRNAPCRVVTVHVPPAVAVAAEQPADEVGVIL
jgi:nucleotide-binding universal stress UspA family protein